MKASWLKIQQLEGLVDTTDVNERENEFLIDVVTRCRAQQGDTAWLSPAQVEWLERIYDRHFA